MSENEWGKTGPEWTVASHSTTSKILLRAKIMQDMVVETLGIAHTIRNVFKDFSLIIAAFSRAICIGGSEEMHQGIKP